MALTTREEVQQLYIGYLGRAADKSGLDYWTNDIESGNITLEQVRSNFVNEQPEYARLYGGLDRAEMVARIYENLFEREFDQVGFDYWVSGGGSTVNADQLIVAFINGAGAPDRAILNDKLWVAQGMTEVAGLRHYDDSSGTSIIADVDGTPAAKASAERILLTTSQYLSDPDNKDAKIIGVMQGAEGKADTVTAPGRNGKPDVFWINTDNFDKNGDKVVLNDFEFHDTLFLGETYTHRANTAPSSGNNSVLEMFLQQQGDDVLMTAEMDPAGNGLLQITVMGVTVSEMIPTTV